MPVEYNDLIAQQLHDLEIFHTYNLEFCEKKLRGLYGLLNADQDRDIIEWIVGTSVLDIGSGFGSLARRLIDTGFTVTAIEPDESARAVSKEWNHVDALPLSIYNVPFEDSSFDTIIFRECVEHLNFDLALIEAKRIVRKRVIIFQTNFNLLVSLFRYLIKQREFNPQDLGYYESILKKNGFTITYVAFRDPVAFPLSGGYVRPQLIPHYPQLERRVLSFDRQINALLNHLHLGKYIAWRYLLVADKRMG